MLNPDYFPLQSLPPVLHDAVVDAHFSANAPISLVICSALSASSICIQGCRDVMRPNGITSPVSLYMLAVAESGDRKTTVDNIFTQQIRNFESKLKDGFQQQMETYKSDAFAWGINSRRLAREYKSKIASGQDKTIENHTKNQPRKPVLKRFLYVDATPEAIKYGLHASSSSIGIFSSEASAVLDGYASSDLAFFNDAWSGSSLNVDRRTQESFGIEEPRVSISLAMQPVIFMKFLAKHGEKARGMGLWARFMFAFPTSIQGYRPLNGYTPPWDRIIKLQDRLESFLTESQMEESQQKSARKMLTFDPIAANHWINFYNYIETQSAPTGELFNVRDYASKLADNVARIAALFHTLDSDTLEINEAAILGAIDVGYWYLREFRRLWDSPTISPEQYDAEMLRLWMVNFLKTNPGALCISKSHLSKYVNNPLRNLKRREQALQVLINLGLIFITVDNRRKRWINPTPLFYQWPQYNVLQTAHRG